MFTTNRPPTPRHPRVCITEYHRTTAPEAEGLRLGRETGAPVSAIGDVVRMPSKTISILIFAVTPSALRHWTCLRCTFLCVSVVPCEQGLFRHHAPHGLDEPNLVSSSDLWTPSVPRDGTRILPSPRRVEPSARPLTPCCSAQRCDSDDQIRQDRTGSGRLRRYVITLPGVQQSHERVVE
jgi:hypothetical protein